MPIRSRMTACPPQTNQCRSVSTIQWRCRRALPQEATLYYSNGHATAGRNHLVLRCSMPRWQSTAVKSQSACSQASAIVLCATQPASARSSCASHSQRGLSPRNEEQITARRESRYYLMVKSMPTSNLNRRTRPKIGPIDPCTTVAAERLPLANCASGGYADNLPPLAPLPRCDLVHDLLERGPAMHCMQALAPVWPEDVRGALMPI